MFPFRRTVLQDGSNPRAFAVPPQALPNRPGERFYKTAYRPTANSYSLNSSMYVVCRLMSLMRLFSRSF